MKYNIVLTASFYKDAEEISHYITYRLGAPKAAERLVADAYQSIKSLANSPCSGRVFTLSDGTSTVYRRINIRNYALFYSVDERTNTVYIQRFIYGRRNLDQILT
ncbi:MAG: type II toxin-antitoxin system RelE/ParE family toxin [Oscillospiraceae bacterium]|nr:type II toxin-antitoxin system RelE/ParE family toxin [Oscillospiraceae bacterium]